MKLWASALRTIINTVVTLSLISIIVAIGLIIIMSPDPAGSAEVFDNDKVERFVDTHLRQAGDQQRLQKPMRRVSRYAPNPNASTLVKPRHLIQEQAWLGDKDRGYTAVNEDGTMDTGHWIDNPDGATFDKFFESSN